MSTPLLPQNDPSPGDRRIEVAAQAQALPYDHDRFEGAAFAPWVPESDRPNAAWVLELIRALVKIGHNVARATDILSKMSPRHPRHQEFVNLVRSTVGAGGVNAAFAELKSSIDGKYNGTERARSLADFEALFEAQNLPSSARVFQDDLYFARMRVAGPNPMMLHRILELPDRFPVTAADVDQAMRVFAARGLDVADGGLDQALEEGRVFLADYALFDGAPTGTWAEGPKYLYAPLSLYVTAGADRALLPVAIQVSQSPGPDAPIITPADGAAWKMAKTAVMVADANMHQAVVHLGRTHLVMEAWALAARRNLAQVHPVARLLAPHFEGTFYINNAADITLTGAGGGVDVVMGGTIEFSRAAAVKGAQTWSFTGSMLVSDLRGRGVDDPDTLPDYPYRDDALLVHSALREWVEAFVRSYYTADADVQSDWEVQAMFHEAGSAEGGRLADVPRIGTIRALVEALTHIIFTGSVQHAAVNFPQLSIMAYAPAFPLSGFRAVRGKSATDAEWLDMLPSLYLAQYQANLGMLLGSVHHTRLGRYPLGLHGSLAQDRRLIPHLIALRRRLREVERTIHQRNAVREPYPFLLPSQIPQSINI